jgi:hypothetical protein
MKLCSSCFFCFILFSSLVCFSQTKYSDLYGKEFHQAIQFYNSNKKQFEKTASKVGLKSDFIFSIVAPEISQFNSVYNEVELYSLQVMYTQFGKDYSDFSVGYFQMKPSFVESIENNIKQNPKQFKDYNDLLFKDPQSKKSRITRLERLNSLQWQLKYLAAFCAIVENRFKSNSYSSTEEKLKFYAAAYNSGYNKSKEHLTNMQKKTYFPKIAKQKFNYSEISVQFYNKIKQ